MYQRAFNEVGAYGHAHGSTAQKLSTLIHGVNDEEHPHKETMKALFNKRSPLAPSQRNNELNATARFGASTASYPSHSGQHVSQSATIPQHHGAVVPTGAELSSLYRGNTLAPMVVSPPILSSTGGTSYYPPPQRAPTPPVSSTYLAPPQQYAVSGPVHSSSTMGVLPGGPSALTTSFGPSGTGVGSTPIHTSSGPQLPSSTTALGYGGTPAAATVSRPMPVYHSAKYEYAPVGQSVMGMASTPVHTPVVHAPGLTPMGRDVEARSGSTGAPAILSRRETERLQRQAAKEAQRQEKQEEKKEKKKKSCCK